MGSQKQSFQVLIFKIITVGEIMIRFGFFPCLEKDFVYATTNYS